MYKKKEQTKEDGQTIRQKGDRQNDRQTMDRKKRRQRR